MAPRAPDSLQQRVQRSSQQRREAGKAALRVTIVREAAELLLANGYEAFSLRQVAERIGYSATTIYRYFKNKDELVSDVIDAGFRLFGERVREAAASESDVVLRLRALARAYVKFGLEHPVYYRVMFVIRPDLIIVVPADRRARWGATFQALVSAVEALVSSGRTSYTDVGALSKLLWAQVHGIVTLAIAMHVYQPEEAAAAVELVFQLIGPELGRD